MMSLSTIKAMSDEAAEQAASEDLAPFVYWDVEEVDRRESFPFPQLGDWVPRGWEVAGDRYFCNSSGMGAPDEPAMTAGQLRSEIKRRIGTEPGIIGWGIVEVGQFQVCVQAYRKVTP